MQNTNVEISKNDLVFLISSTVVAFKCLGIPLNNPDGYTVAGNLNTSKVSALIDANNLGEDVLVARLAELSELL